MFSWIHERLNSRRLPHKAPAIGLLAMTALSLSGCDPFHTDFAPVEPAVHYQAADIKQPTAKPDTLVVMDWNVKFGAGRIDFFFDCHGDRAVMNKKEVYANLDALAKKIRDANPDVLLVQEIDAMSRRGAYIDQIQYLLDKTDLNYAAYASQWRADYVPSDGIGQVNSGNAILSKYPLKEATRIALPLIGEQSGLTQYFYLKRNMLRARLDVGRDNIYVVNVHTAAYSQDGTKRDQIDLFKKELDRLNTEGATFVAGGDLNALPPGTTQIKGFDDFVCEEGGEFDADDYSGEVGWLDALYDAYTPAVPLADYMADNTAHFTHTTDKKGMWNRKLDYLFTNGTFTQGSALTHQDEAKGGTDTMPLSDHAPITVTWELP